MHSLHLAFVKFLQTTKSYSKLLILVLILCLNSSNLHAQGGLHGYIASNTKNTPPEYNKGVTFYSAVWRLLPQPIRDFQIGLPGTWVIPNNSDNQNIPLCPPGTQARDYWPERGPTYSDVFQTMEGGLGWWGHNRFHYGPPKFVIGGTPNCYSGFLSTPGFGFNSDKPLPDSLLGIVQLSNRILIPPDGLTFDGDPHGDFLGYGYLALPLTEPKTQPQPTGSNNWTLFLNSQNFKGPVAYYLPEAWSRIAKNYPVINGRTMDSRSLTPGGGGTMEINTVPIAKGKDSQGKTYTKIPQIQFPLQENGKSILVRDFAYYSENALYKDIENWRKGGTMPAGKISQGVYYPSISPGYIDYSQEGVPIEGGFKDLFTPTVFADNAFGFQWKNASGNTGLLPQYFSDEGTKRVPVELSALPAATGLKTYEFPGAVNSNAPYKAELKGAWAAPGPALGPYTVVLRDASIVTYFWYRFIDQPVFQQLKWPTEEKEKLQKLVEQIHTNWTIDKTYIEAPKAGKLVAMDPNLIITPPAGLEKGYVPIVVSQSTLAGYDCSFARLEADVQNVIDANTSTPAKEVKVQGSNFPYKFEWSNGTIGPISPLRADETFYVYVTDRFNCKRMILSAPVALPERGLDNQSFIASWKAVPAAVQYEVQVATDSTFKNILAGWQNKSISSTRIEVEKTTGINQYFYRVRAIGVAGEQSRYSNTIAVSTTTLSCRIDVTANKSDLSRAGASDGQAALAVKGGTAPYAYKWSNGAQTSTLTRLAKGTYTVTVSDAAKCETTLAVEIGLPVGKGSIGNRVWYDQNQNGRDDFGEPGIPNVSLVLWRDANGDGKPETFSGVVKTDSNGNYRFSNLEPGAYQVFVWEIDNWGIGQPLYNLINTTGDADPNNDLDKDDNAQDANTLVPELSALNKISKPIILTAGGEPLLDGDPTSADFNFDPAGNMTVDFGFYNPKDCPKINGQISGTPTACVNKTEGSLSVNLASGLYPYAYKWNTGAEGPSLANLAPGQYSVTILDANKCSGELSYTITPTSPTTCTTTRVSNALLENVKVFPNPVSNFLTIAYAEPQSLMATVYDLQGKTLQVQKIQSGSTTLDLTAFTNGFYFLVLKDLKSLAKKTFKIVKLP